MVLTDVLLAEQNDLDELGDNPLCSEDPLYALPAKIIACLRHGGLISRTAAAHEQGLADYCRYSGAVGFFRGMPVTYDLLRDPPDQLRRLERHVGEFLELRGESHRLGQATADLQERFLPVAYAQRGYAGWLVSNKVYLSELGTLVRRWRRKMARHRIPVIGSTNRGALFDPVGRRYRNGENQFIRDFAEFFARWRLDGLATPDLPVPLLPQAPVLVPDLSRRHLALAGFNMSLPDICSVPSRDQLRHLGNDMLAHHTPDHLREWTAIVRREDVGDNSGAGKDSKDRPGVSQYGHLLAVHHYLQVIMSRYADGIAGHVKTVDEAIANHLCQSTANIRLIRSIIRKRMGQ